ncbi:hypothetical protein Lp90_1974 [Lactiplantibacillus plantarum]|uniref:hypothetical protein n=1 Tax=Lactiplantibacillus plantarum TaxID=1590 RepID=UPI0004DD5971|nr:hypothetical protein [Lactiplantibacillus plantarum]KEZ13061.1 hypothetical protein Lp90_1974 [Lactiplantibacillus plantarum]
MLNTIYELEEVVATYEQQDKTQKKQSLVKRLFTLGIIFCFIVFVTPVMNVDTIWALGIIIVIAAYGLVVARRYYKISDGGLNDAPKKYLTSFINYLNAQELYDTKIIQFLIENINQEVEVRVKKRNSTFTVIGVLTSIFLGTLVNSWFDKFTDICNWWLSAINLIFPFLGMIVVMLMLSVVMNRLFIEDYSVLSDTLLLLKEAKFKKLGEDKTMSLREHHPHKGY